ncbi:hypothetical protein ERO13_A08G002200v2 [Gossypium hirsutum]|uniref:TmcB/TmcC TPR repeats domain-containing protein n=1 Tax=Gossypium hirsutum TaxID=3635 RepID=A0A1U8M0X8_GOSHI|nr:uncharacterized protein LOC107931863 [Gossypium hirsutum]KAG4185809.1 hypothetical protein ERO13_A08G002200v2 [Gossypium hirsutum]
MVVKVAANLHLQLSEPNLTQSSAVIPSPSFLKRCRTDAVLVSKTVNRSTLFGSRSAIINRSKSSEIFKPKHKASSPIACIHYLSDDEFPKRINDSALRFHLHDGDETDGYERSDDEEDSSDNKLQWGESACCSMKKAFSSTVFIIRELHSYTLQMRESLLCEDLQGIFIRVQNEIHASFLWLFQQVFSHTPTLMIYVMILLANFSVHSMGNNAALAAETAVNPMMGSYSYVSSSEVRGKEQTKYDSLQLQNGKTGRGRGGGGKARPVACGGDEWFDETEWEPSEEELSHQNSIVDGTYCRTELVYKKGLSQEPNNPLLLANYAQFLYLVVHDYDRAEELFKKAIQMEPVDAEAHNKYAIFLWKAKKDMWAAEENFLEAIEVDPNNSYYPASYANFLWSTGGEDTCFPLGSSDGIA